jgi:hypothetical protein
MAILAGFTPLRRGRLLVLGKRFLQPETVQQRDVMAGAAKGRLGQLENFSALV